MSRLRFGALTVVLVVGALVLVGRIAPATLAQTPPDRSEVVLVLDFSASILDDKANRDRFAAALDRIADRVDATSADLVAGDATVAIVQFATSGADYPGCVDLKLFGNPGAVARLANCLRDVAKAYRKGLDPPLTAKIGIDTNYVAAMEQAARHLAADAIRPALILFTDGKHDVAGVPSGEVQPARDRLFGSRSTFALLPVGMGLRSTERAALESGLAKLRIIRNMPACVSGARFDWPQVVFESPAEAGNAVAVALQNVTCTFTVAPRPSPTPSPAPAPLLTPGAVRSVTLTPGDGRIEVAWKAPTSQPAPIVGYQVRCRAGEGAWIEPTGGPSLGTSVAVEGLTNGEAYECEVAAVDAKSVGPWRAAGATVTPVGRPAAPGKPGIDALDRGLRFRVPAEDTSQLTGYRYECSNDKGSTWPIQLDVAAPVAAPAEIGNLSNGVEYVCRAFAANSGGLSDPSVAADAVRPCGSLFECQPVVVPIVGVVGFLGLGGLLLSLLALYRTRTRGYVVAVVDVIHTANLGSGSRLGIGFVRDNPHGPVTGIVADRNRGADIQIRYRGGDRFEVADRANRYSTTSGQPLVTVDSQGMRHSIVLRAFRTATAAAGASQR